MFKGQLKIRCRNNKSCQMGMRDNLVTMKFFTEYLNHFFMILDVFER